MESCLQFLQDKIVVYYTGLDEKSLPFKEGTNAVNCHSRFQVIYLKALALVADYIIVPPSSYFSWVNCHKSSNLVDSMLQLHKAGIVVSSIYTGMNSGIDYLDRKIWSGSARDKEEIHDNRKLLTHFFQNLPVIQRDVKGESSRFQESLITEVCSLQPTAVLDDLLSLLHRENDLQVVISRSILQTYLYAQYMKRLLPIREFRKLYYSINRNYYRVGSCWYSSSISIIDANRYSILGMGMFSEPNMIMLGYDPQIILRVLCSFGIDMESIDKMTIDDLMKIRSSTVGRLFKHSYGDFVRTIQEAEIKMKGFSNEKLHKINDELIMQFVGVYFKQSNMRNKKAWETSFGWTSLLSLLGIICIHSTPIGIIIAALGWFTSMGSRIRWFKNISEKIMVNMIDKQDIFYAFIIELKGLLDRLENDSIKQHTL